MWKKKSSSEYDDSGSNVTFQSQKLEGNDCWTQDMVCLVLSSDIIHLE
jgi:hypothetical protein